MASKLHIIIGVDWISDFLKLTIKNLVDGLQKNRQSKQTFRLLSQFIIKLRLF